MTERVECIVIGAGCVGLAIARALALAGREVILLEQHDSFGTETSSRNSEVIHAGIYYEPNSLKARLCVRGKHLLYAYMTTRGIAFDRCGKLVVATSPDEVPRLSFFQERARENGVQDLEMMSAEDAVAMEPLLSCEAALWSPSTGVMDSHNYMLSLLGDFENAGGIAVFNAPFIRASSGAPFTVEVGGDSAMTLQTDILINSCGLHASHVASKIDGLAPQYVAETRYAKGRYFSITGKPPFERLIYPMPTNDSQGTHYTRDFGGQGRLGPDIVWGAKFGDYDVEEEARREFWRAATRFLPSLDKSKLHAAYAGLRPKIGPPGQWMDFRIDDHRQHGIPGLVNLFGIESPGLTSSLAIGEYVAAML